MSIGIWVLIPAAGRWPTRIIGVFRIARPRGSIFIGRATTSVCVPITAVIKLTWRCSASVVIPTRAVASGRTAPVIVLVIWSRRIRTTSTGGAGAVPVTAPIIWPCAVGNAWLERRRRRRVADFRDAGNLLSLELTAVQLLDCGLQVCSCLIFDESAKTSAWKSTIRRGLYAPSAVALTANLGVNNVESRLTGEIFQVLRIEVKPCPNIQ
jgi:hypothetical protein